MAIRLAMISSFPPSKDGLAVYTYKLCKAVTDVNKKVQILVVSNVDLCDKNSIERINVVKALGNPFTYPFKVFLVLTRWKPNVIHCQHEFWLYGRGVFSVMFIVMLVLLKTLRRPIVTTIHGIVARAVITPDYLLRHSSNKHLASVKRNYFTFLIKVIGKLSHKVIVHLDIIKLILLNDYGYSESKVMVIRHGVDPPEVKMDRKVARRKLGLPVDSIILLCFGEIRRGKGIEHAIEAVAKLKEMLPNVLFMIAGIYSPESSPESRGYLEELMSKIKNLKLERHVIIRAGFIPEEDVYTMISASDVMLLPYTDIETIRAPGPLYRAASCNLPVVASKSEMFEDITNTNGLNFAASKVNAETLSRAVEVAFSNKRGWITNKILTWQEVAKKVLNLYTALLFQGMRSACKKGLIRDLHTINFSEGKLPFITICMPVYNSNWCLSRVLESILNLDYPKNLLRLVFVDSYSTDGSWECLQRFKKRFEKEYEAIIMVRSPKRGVGHARNLCLQYVNGWVFWADSDVTLPRQVLRHLLTHFERDPKVGWARCAWTRNNPTLYERVVMSRIPKTYRYVDETELTSSLIRQEAMRDFGPFYEDGGEPFNSWEAAEQYVRLRKAGWRIVNDGVLSGESLHLIPPRKHWGRFFEADERCVGKIRIFLRQALKIARYYLTEPPKRPVHELIRAGDVKLAIKMIYWLGLPYVTVCAIVFRQFLLLLYLLPPIAVYAYESRSWLMKLMVPCIQAIRWILVAHGYVLLLLRLVISHHNPSK
jgi:glycosyltransferase involved in cell wall biosynthesis